MIPIIVGVLGIVPKSLEKRLTGLEIRGRIMNIQTTALLRSARILRRVLEMKKFVVTQTPAKYHQLKLVWKTHKEWNNNNNDNNNNSNNNNIHGLYLSLDTQDPFSSGPEMKLDKWTKELEN